MFIAITVWHGWHGARHVVRHYGFPRGFADVSLPIVESLRRKHKISALWPITNVGNDDHWVATGGFERIEKEPCAGDLWRTSVLDVFLSHAIARHEWRASGARKKRSLHRMETLAGGPPVYWLEERCFKAS